MFCAILIVGIFAFLLLCILEEKQPSVRVWPKEPFYCARCGQAVEKVDKGGRCWRCAKIGF